jgi:hypothetical protein
MSPMARRPMLRFAQAMRSCREGREEGGREGGRKGGCSCDCDRHC